MRVTFTFWNEKSQPSDPKSGLCDEKVRANSIIRRVELDHVIPFIANNIIPHLSVDRICVIDTPNGLDWIGPTKDWIEI